MPPVECEIPAPESPAFVSEEGGWGRRIKPPSVSLGCKPEVVCERRQREAGPEGGEGDLFPEPPLLVTWMRFEDRRLSAPSLKAVTGGAPSGPCAARCGDWSANGGLKFV